MSEDEKKSTAMNARAYKPYVRYCLIFFMQTSTNAMDLVFCRFFDEHVK